VVGALRVQAIPHHSQYMEEVGSTKDGQEVVGLTRVFLEGVGTIQDGQEGVASTQVFLEGVVSTQVFLEGVGSTRVFLEGVGSTLECLPLCTSHHMVGDVEVLLEEAHMVGDAEVRLEDVDVLPVDVELLLEGVGSTQVFQEGVDSTLECLEDVAHHTGQWLEA